MNSVCEGRKLQLSHGIFTYHSFISYMDADLCLYFVTFSRCVSVFALQHKWYKQTDRTVYNDIALLITHDDLDFSTSHAVQPVPYLANRKLDYLATRARNDKCVTIGDGVLVSPTGSQDFGRVLFSTKTFRTYYHVQCVLLFQWLCLSFTEYVRIIQ